MPLATILGPKATNSFPYAGRKPLSGARLTCWLSTLPEAERLLNLAYALAAVVERDTGLEGYDPQTDLAIADSTPAVSTMSAIATELQDVPAGYTGRANDDAPDASPH
jgi:hypothetical protein